MLDVTQTNPTIYTPTTLPTCPVEIEEGRVEFDPKSAKYVLANMTYGRQRKISEAHIEVLAELMRSGLMLPGSQIAFGRLPDGSLVTANGHHRLHGVVKSGRPQVFQVLIVDCKNADDLAKLYWKFDTNNKARSTEQILNAADIAEKYDLAKDVAKAVYNSAGFLLNNMKPPKAGDKVSAVKRKIHDYRLMACEPYWACAKSYGDAIKKAPIPVKKKLLTASVTAAALLTLRYAPVVAERFWSGLAKNDRLASGDPRATLLQFLLVNNDQGSGQHFAGAVAAAWNAYINDRFLHNIRPRIPFAMDGTPFSGRANNRGLV